VSDRASALPLLAVVAVVAAGHLSLYPGVADLDGFYHVGHARAYLEGSPFDTSLPWATRSIIGDVGGDLWWGFHMLLVPFAALGVEAGLHLAAVVLTLVLGLSVLLVLRRHGVEGAGWWAALFLLAVPNIFFRHLMVRPHVLSLAASLVLLSVLVRGRWWHVGILSALISWLHLSLFWLGPAITAVYAVARVPVTVGLGRSRPDVGVPIRAALPAALGGAALGWLLRPDAVDALTLLNVQLVELFALQAMDVPLTFAQELTPIGAFELIRMSGLFFVAWVVGIGALMVVCVRALASGGTTATAEGQRGTREGQPGTRDGQPGMVTSPATGDAGAMPDPTNAGGGAFGGQERATLIVAAAVLSMVFLLLAVVSARRAMEQWVAFGFLLLPLLWEVGRAQGWSRARRLLPVLGAVLVAAHLGWFGWRHHLNVSLVAFSGSTLEEASEFLEARSEPGDVVFHARWDNFGPLFARNRVNRYLGGMDPVFLFAHDPASYWEFFFLSTDATTEWTCDAFPCRDGTATDTHQALTDHFGARWVLVEPSRNPRLSLYLLDDPRFELALDTGPAAVFEILYEDG